jgi:hypothetical protein
VRGACKRQQRPSPYLKNSPDSTRAPSHLEHPDVEVVLDVYTTIGQPRNRAVYKCLQYFGPEALKPQVAEYGLALTET